MSSPDPAPDPAPAAAPAARTLGQFIRMIEDGAFDAAVSEALRDLNAAMSQHVISYGGKPRGRIRLDFDFLLDAGVFEISASFDVRGPRPPARPRSFAWSTSDNAFTPQNPRQMQLFAPPRPPRAGEAAE